jgi:hypothetical protein
MLDTSFNSDQTEMIIKAIDDAWAQLRGPGADPAMASLVRTALESELSKCRRTPQMNAQRLTDDAIARVK